MSLHFDNPICIAPVPIETYHSNCSQLGGIFTKSITLEPREPNRGQIVYDLGNGNMLNRMGLDNSGLEWFINYRLPYLQSIGCPIYVSVADNYEQICRALGKCEIAGIELNLSCPNVQFDMDPIFDVVDKCRRATDKPLIAKLASSPYIVTEARACKAAGADAITAINTVRGLVVDNGVVKLGGLSGKQIKHIALKAVYDLTKSVDIPVIGCGGVSSERDVMDMLTVGATAIQIGTAELLTPGTAGWLTQRLETS